MSERPEGLTFDIALVGVGGQGLLTIGELIAVSALEEDLAVTYYPTKGMAQRGGGVKVQVRIGRDVIGPEIPQEGADLVIALERSEALKAVPYVSQSGEFLLYGHVWEPTQVMLGKADYPTLEEVRQVILDAGADFLYLDPEQRPRRDGAAVPANIYVLGAALGRTGLAHVLNPEAVASLVRKRWEKYRVVNEEAFRAGLEADVHAW